LTRAALRQSRAEQSGISLISLIFLISLIITIIITEAEAEAQTQTRAKSGHLKGLDTGPDLT
jgi:hypothetical protein